MGHVLRDPDIGGTLALHAPANVWLTGPCCDGRTGRGGVTGLPHLNPQLRRARSWQRRLHDIGDELLPARKAAVVSLMHHGWVRSVLALLAWAGVALGVAAAPYVPNSDDQVVERLALRASDPV